MCFKYNCFNKYTRIARGNDGMEAIGEINLVLIKIDILNECKM